MTNRRYKYLFIESKMDQITVNRISLLHPMLREEALEIYKDICEALKGKSICRFAYTFRTFKEQDTLYSYGRTDKSKKIVTMAKGGESYHNYGLAIDIVLLQDKNGDGTFETANFQTDVDFDGDGTADWMEVVAIFKKYGWEAGIDWKFKDAPHFQKTFGVSVKELYKRYSERKVDQNGYATIYR